MASSRIDIPSGPSGALNYPRATANPSGEALGEISESLYRANKAKRDIEDTIEANRLLSEHTVRAKEIQSELLRTDLREDEILPVYTKKLEELEKEIVGKARSGDVQQLLQQHIPNRNAGKLVEMSAESDRRFASQAMSKYEAAAVDDSVAYVSATSDADRKDIKNRHTRLIGILKSTGVFDDVSAGRAEKKFLRSLDLYDAKKSIQLVPEMGVLAITEPKKFLERFPGLTVEDLDNMFQESIQVQNHRYTLEQRQKKEKQDEATKLIDEGIIRGHIGLEDVTDAKTGKIIRGISAYRDLVPSETYTRMLHALDKQNQEGGFDDPKVKLNLKSRILNNPSSVSPAEISGSTGLSGKSKIELLEYKETIRKSFYERASETDPAFKGPLFGEGKRKIMAVLGGMTENSQYFKDADDARRTTTAIDEYMERVRNKGTKDEATIADEIIEKYQKPQIRQELIKDYRDDKKPDKYDFKKMLANYEKEKDPIKKRELAKALKELMETKE